MAAVDDSSDNKPPTPPSEAAPGGDDKPAADDRPPAMPDQHPRWADPIFRAGLAVGAGLFVIGILCQTFNLIAPTLSILIICSGLGIIFGAFGSTAVLNYKGFVIAGVAAISIALLLIVNWVMRETLLKLEIDGEVKGARLELLGDTAFPGADHGRRFEFYIIGRSVAGDRDRFTLVVTPPQGEGNIDGRTIEFGCIPSTAITRFIGSGRTLQWTLDAKNQLLRNVEGRTIQSGPCLDSVRDGPVIAGLGLIGSAHAQEGDIAELLADLDSDSATIRRDARERLAALGQAAVVPMLDHWAAHPESYRIRLGVSVALTEFLREHKAERKSVAALLTEDHLRLLAEAAGDPDRTLRIYASEFLYDLGDPRVVPVAVEIFPTASDDGRYNLIVAIQGAVPDLGAEERQALAETLRTWQGMVGPNTQRLIGTLMADLVA